MAGFVLVSAVADPTFLLWYFPDHDSTSNHCLVPHPALARAVDLLAEDLEDQSHLLDRCPDIHTGLSLDHRSR